MMKQYKLSEEEQKQIPHFIAQKAFPEPVSPKESLSKLKIYLEIYNNIRNELENYNESST